MKYKLIRRFFIMRLALSFLLDSWKISRVKKSLSGDQQTAEINRIFQNAGKRMKRTAFRLEGIIVKAGQFLSMREDIFPQAFTEQLKDLQDTMPAASFELIKPIIERDLHRKLHTVFRDFNRKATAAASLAQVHKAVLHDGTIVAVKVIKPGMERLAKADLDSLGLVAKITQRIPAIRKKMNFVQLHREFTETIERELDCRQELQHLERFERMFAGDPHIKIPKAYEPFTTRRVLVMEYIEGAKVTDKRTLTEWNISGLSIARTLLDAYFRQVFIYGFIHVDPHPGNLLIRRDHRLCFLDFGMVDELSAEEIQTLRGLMQSIMMGNVDAILSAFQQLGFLPPGSNSNQLKPLISVMLAKLTGQPNQGDQTAGLRSVLHSGSVQLQAKYMFIIRAIGLLVTELRQLAPQADWFELLATVGLPIFHSPIESQKG